MNLTIPEFALVILVGVSGSGKSTFARKHFKPTEIVSSDSCRALVSDDETDQGATKDAFEVLHLIAAKRLHRRLLTVIDATNVQPSARQPLLEIAKQNNAPAIAIVLNLPEAVCVERNRQRADRQVGAHVMARQFQRLRDSLGSLQSEGFRDIYTLSTPEEVNETKITRQTVWAYDRSDRGPFDIIGDVHGCYDELAELLSVLGYTVGNNYSVTPPAGRRAIFVGDLVDRGPNTPAVLKLAMGMVAAKTALCVPGNHDNKLMRKLKGHTVQITHGLSASLDQLAHESPEFNAQVVAFFDDLPSHYVLADGALVVAHAGMREDLQGHESRRVRDFALYGETTGETDEYGLPVRIKWAENYRGRALVVYGHTPVREAEWINNTVNIDTGCVFGGKLSALHYPERELVSVPAHQEYSKSGRPFLTMDI